MWLCRCCRWCEDDDAGAITITNLSHQNIFVCLQLMAFAIAFQWMFYPNVPIPIEFFFSSFTFISFPTFFPFVFFFFILNNISLFSLSFHSKANIYILLRQSYKFREKKLFYLHCSLHWERKCSKEKYSKNIHKKYNVLLYIHQIRMMCVVTNHQNNRSRAFSVHWSHRIYLFFFLSPSHLVLLQIFVYLYFY